MLGTRGSRQLTSALREDTVSELSGAVALTEGIASFQAALGMSGRGRP